MSVAVSTALALNLLLQSAACCASVLCKTLQLAEPSVKGNPYGALHNSHMQNDTGGLSLFLDLGCFLLVVVDWCSVFSNEFCNLPNFFAKSQQSCVHILFNFQVPLYTSYILLHFGLQQQLFRPRNFWNPFKEYLCCLLWADLSYVSLCFRLEKIKCKPELRLSAQFISSDTKLW